MDPLPVSLLGHLQASWASQGVLGFWAVVASTWVPPGASSMAVEGQQPISACRHIIAQPTVAYFLGPRASLALRDACQESQTHTLALKADGLLTVGNSYFQIITWPTADAV